MNALDALLENLFLAELRAAAMRAEAEAAEPQPQPEPLDEAA